MDTDGGRPGCAVVWLLAADLVACSLIAVAITVYLLLR